VTFKSILLLLAAESCLLW